MTAPSLQLLIVAALISLSSACAPRIPLSLQTSLPDNPPLSAVQAGVERHMGRAIRWGGVIQSLENRAADSWVEVVERPLGSDTRPLITDRSGGRFIAKIAGFLDPAIYTAGREITLQGVVEGETARKIGDYEYRFPVLNATTLHLWNKPKHASAYTDPFRYDPWYPFYPSWWYRPYHPYYW